MCQHSSLHETLAAGHLIAVNYHPKPNEEIEAIIECEHGQRIPFIFESNTEQFTALYACLWKKRMERAEQLE